MFTPSALMVEIWVWGSGGEDMIMESGDLGVVSR